MHEVINNVLLHEMDKTYAGGSKAIDTVSASNGIIEHVEGCQLHKNIEIIESDHRPCIFDIALNEYFNERLEQWD